jgi:NTE family protein
LEPGLDSESRTAEEEMPIAADPALPVLTSYFGTSPEETAALNSEMDTVGLQGGDWLFRQGDAGDALFFLLRGRLQVWIAASEDAGDGTCVAEVGPGESVGEVGLLTGGTRSASLRAIRDSLLLRIDRAAFERLASAHPGLALQLGTVMARRLHERTNQRASYAQNRRSIALVTVNDTPRTRAFGADLAATLAARDRTLHVTSDRLAALGAPCGHSTPADGPATAMTHWLDDQENRHRFLLLETALQPNPWTRLCLRQADLIVLVAEATEAPAAELPADLLPEDIPARRTLVLLQPTDREQFPGTAAWLARVPAQEHVHVSEARDVERVARSVTGEATGLVLGGGGARGFAHIGVYRALVELGIPIDYLGGTSIGSIFAAGMALGRDPDALQEEARRAFVDGKPFSDFVLPLVALLRGQRMARSLRAAWPYQIEDLPLPFFCVSTNMARATLQIHRQGDLPRALCASSSLPGVFPPTVVEGELAVDGGLLNNLPVDIMRQQSVGPIIAVDLSSQREYKLDYTDVPGPMRILAGRWLPFMRRYRVPGIMTSLLKAQEVGSLIHARSARAQAALVLQPDVNRFKLTDVQPFHAIVEAGYRHAMEHIPAWQASRSELSS